MSKTHSILKLRFNPEDFKKVIGKLYDYETGIFNLDKLLPVPRTLQMPVCTDLVKSDDNLFEMRVCEYAALDYLFSLDISRFEYFKNLLLGISNENYGFHTQVTNTRNAPLSVIVSALNSGDFKRRRKTLKEKTDSLFKDFYEDNMEELTKYGVTSMRDMGKMVVNNLIKYHCVEADAWRSKTQGFGGFHYSDGNVYSFGEPKLEVATNGFNALYFDAYDISTYFLISKMAEALGENGEDMSIDVVEFNAGNQETMYYNPAKPNSLRNKLNTKWFDKYEFIDEVNTMFGREVYRFKLLDEFYDNDDFNIEPITPLLPSHPSIPFEPIHPFEPNHPFEYTPFYPYGPGIRRRRFLLDDLEPYCLGDDEIDVPKTYKKEVK